MTVGWQFKVVEGTAVAKKEIWAAVISGNQGNCTIFPKGARLQDSTPKSHRD